MISPNLHSVWLKVLGIAPTATTHPGAQTTPATALQRAVAAMMASASPGATQGWQPTTRVRPACGPVGIKKQLGPGLWVSTVAVPGDARYPAQA